MGGVATRKDWPRLANEVRTRRTELGLTQEDARAAGGPSTATMRLIEGALQDAYTPAILRRLEGAMRWRPGSVRDILAGGDPVPLDGAPSAPALTPALSPDPVLSHILAAARRRPAPGAPSAVRAHLFAALAAVNAPLSAQVLAEAAAGRPFTDPIERAIWESPDWPRSDEEKAEEIAAFRARRAESDGQATETG